MEWKLDKNKQVIINILSGIVAFMINLIINFFLSPYIVKNLGEEVNGFVQLANNFIMYASLITIALNSMGGRFISISYHKEDYKLANTYYSSLIVGNIIILTILVVPAIICIDKLEYIINISTGNIYDVKMLFSFVFVTFFVTQINGILNIATYVTNKLYLSNIVSMVKSILNVILLFIFFSIFTVRIYFVSLVGFILSIFTLFFSYVIKLNVLQNIKFKIYNFKLSSMLEMISCGIWNTINQCGNILMTGLDLLIANILIDPIQMGVLSIAKIVPNSIIQLASIINSNFAPLLVITYTKGTKEDMLKELRSSMKISSVLISIPIMVFSVFGLNFYRLWMPTLDAKILTILSILTCCAFIPFSGPQVLYNVYTVANKLAINSITVIIGGIMNFIIILLLIRHTDLGVYAIAGTSSIISIARNLIITVPYTAKILGLKWYEFYKDVIVSVLCCATSLGASSLVKTIIIPRGWVSMIISVFISCLISCVINMLFVLDKKEKLILKNRISKGVRKNG